MVGNISQVATFTIKEFFMGKICSRDANGNVQVAQRTNSYSSRRSKISEKRQRYFMP